MTREYAKNREEYFREFHSVVANHTHEIKTKPPISNDASVLKEISIGNP